MNKVQCYFYNEDSEDNESEENTKKFTCEMNYIECNRRGYCNGDC